MKRTLLKNIGYLILPFSLNTMAETAFLDFSATNMSVNTTVPPHNFMGNIIKPIEDICLTHIGVYDDLEDGLGSTVSVGIYEKQGSGPHPLVKSAMINQSNSTLDNYFRYIEVPTMTLQAGTYYAIASDISTEMGANTVSTSGLDVSWNLHYIGRFGTYSFAASMLHAQVLAINTNSQTMQFGANFKFDVGACSNEGEGGGSGGGGGGGGSGSITPTNPKCALGPSHPSCQIPKMIPTL